MTHFTDLELPDFLQTTLKKINFLEPTDIQKRALPVLFSGKDLIACSQTGSGKTAAYLIPMVKELLEDPESQGLVLAPTRELAMQIMDFLRLLAPNDRTFSLVSLVGGQDIRKQFKSLQKKPRVVVATPGRLIDHIKRKTVQLGKVTQLVLDEGDRMIDMGFAPQLKQILEHLPKKRQTSFFTATLDPKVQKLAAQYLYNPEKVLINTSKPVAQIKQDVIRVEMKDKDQCILDEINQRGGSVIVFLKTKRRVDILTRYLAEYGVPVDKLHGGCTQGQRNQAISRFRNNKTRVLCATDVAARGLDVPQVGHVINYDLPMQDEDYVHRIGRTGRNGATGEAVTMVTNGERSQWNRLVKKYEIANCQLEVIKKSGGKKSKSKDNQSKPRGFGGPSGRVAKSKRAPSRRRDDDFEDFGRSNKGPKKFSKRRADNDGDDFYAGRKKSTKKFSDRRSDNDGDSFFEGRKKSAKKFSSRKSDNDSESFFKGRKKSTKKFGGKRRDDAENSDGYQKRRKKSASKKFSSDWDEASDGYNKPKRSSKKHSGKRGKSASSSEEGFMKRKKSKKFGASGGKKTSSKKKSSGKPFGKGKKKKSFKRK